MTRIIAFTLSLAMLPALPVHAAKPVIAVFDVEGKNLSSDLRGVLSDYFATRLAASRKYQVMPRDDIKRRLSTQKSESYQACYDESCQIEIGKELAAEQVVSLQVIDAGEICILTVKIYDLRKATTADAAVVEGKCGKAGLLRLAGEAATKLAPSGNQIAAGAKTYDADFVDLDVPLRKEFMVPFEYDGVAVLRVPEGTAAATAGLKRGDVILEAAVAGRRGYRKLKRSEITYRVKDQLPEGKRMMLKVWRNGKVLKFYPMGQKKPAKDRSKSNRRRKPISR